MKSYPSQMSRVLNDADVDHVTKRDFLVGDRVIIKTTHKSGVITDIQSSTIIVKIDDEATNFYRSYNLVHENPIAIAKYRVKNSK